MNLCLWNKPLSLSGHSVQAIVSLKEERCGWPIVEAVTHSEVQGRMSVCLSPCLLDQSPAAPRLQKYADPNFFPSRRILARGGADAAAFIDDEEKKEE